MYTASLLCEFVHVPYKLTTCQTTDHNACIRVPSLGSLLPYLSEHVHLLYLLIQTVEWTLFQSTLSAVLLRLMSLPDIPNEMITLVRKPHIVQSSMFSSGRVVTQVLIPARFTPGLCLLCYLRLFLSQNLNDGQTVIRPNEKQLTITVYKDSFQILLWCLH